MSQPQPDPVIDEIREVRHRLSAELGHDPARIVAALIHLQQTYRNRLITTISGKPAPDQAA